VNINTQKPGSNFVPFLFCFKNQGSNLDGK
jgi:hypothetical protein